MRRRLYVSAALACSVAMTGAIAGLVKAQEDREERKEERRVEERERRGGEVRERETVRRETRAPAPRRAREVLGSKVSIRGDIAIGTVDDIVFSDDGYIDYLVVVNEGKRVVVPWEAASFNFERRAATVDITQERYREIPTYTEERLPNFYAPDYRQRIYTYYGIQPVPERRLLERKGIFRR